MYTVTAAERGPTSHYTTGYDVPAIMTNPRLLTPQQVADRLGQNVDSIRRAIRHGRIPAKKISGRIYVAEEAITPPLDLPAPAIAESAL